jgi:hypothetical protein
MYDHNLDDHGWWEVGGRVHFNKLQAIFDHEQTKQPLTWNYNDLIYDQFDWTVEPAQTLKELYAQRAWHLRNQYDYLVLHFSGGSDSCNILETFIDNGIHLDEILIRGSYTQTSNRAGKVSAADNYAECLTQSLPLAQWAKDNHYPHLKITLVDTTALISNYFEKTPNWIENNISGLSPGFFVKNDLDEISPHYKMLADQGKRVAHVLGVEKPALYRHKNIFYTKWIDIHIATFIITRGTKSQYPQFTECFYWGKNAVPLQIKQLHVLKNFVKANNIPDSMYEAYSGRAAERFIASVIYERTLPLISEHDKEPGGSILADRDSWFGKDPHSVAYQNWYRGVGYLETVLPKHWHNQKGFWHSGIKGLWSKPRYIGT